MELLHNVSVPDLLPQDITVVVFVYVDWSSAVLKLSPRLVRFMNHRVWKQVITDVGLSLGFGMMGSVQVERRTC